MNTNRESQHFRAALTRAFIPNSQPYLGRWNQRYQETCLPHENYLGAKIIEFRITAYFLEHTERNHPVHNHHRMNRYEIHVDGVFAQLTHFFRSISLSHHRRVAPRTKPTMTP
jgi:hypothetical protein